MYCLVAVWYGTSILHFVYCTVRLYQGALTREKSTARGEMRDKNDGESHLSVSTLSHSPLETQALDLLKRNHGTTDLTCKQDDESHNNKNNNRNRDDDNGVIQANVAVSCINETNVIFPTVCRGTSTTMQESTSSLLAARAFAKAKRFGLAWDAIDSLLASQYDDGFLPKYQFYPNTSQFPLHNNHYANDNDNDNDDNSSEMPAMGYISGLPLYATVVLEVFGWSHQTPQDVKRLARAFPKIYRHHEYLHINRVGYNVLHPWELLTDTSLTDYWDKALGTVYQQMKRTNWTPSSQHDALPLQLVEEEEEELLRRMPPRLLDAGIYLLECHKNVTRQNYKSHSHSTKKNDTLREECGFAVHDVAYAAVWAKANSDLQQVGEILWGKQLLTSSVDILAQLELWSLESNQQLYSLWRHDEQRFVSKTLSYPPDRYNDGWLTRRDASNFVGLWQSRLNQSFVEAQVFHLLQHQGPYAFDCGEYPLWSMGGCNANSTISPLVNYLVSTGLVRNDAKGLGAYITNSTLNLMCGSDDGNDLTQCPMPLSFLPFYPPTTLATTTTTTTSSLCGSTSTLTGAVAYNMLLPDLPLNFAIAPPLTKTWVLVLVGLELFIAFAMGLGCLLMSLHLRSLLRPPRNHTDDEGESMEGTFYMAYETLSDYDNEEEVGEDDITEPTSSSRRRRQRSVLDE